MEYYEHYGINDVNLICCLSSVTITITGNYVHNNGSLKGDPQTPGVGALSWVGSFKRDLAPTTPLLSYQHNMGARAGLRTLKDH